jgi:hypothetical protein
MEYLTKLRCGEMSELAEGARLEIACTAKRRYRGFESLSLRHIYFNGYLNG